MTIIARLFSAHDIIICLTIYLYNEEELFKSQTDLQTLNRKKESRSEANVYKHVVQLKEIAWHK